MINWAFGMFWDSVKELMVGTMMSWWPFTTRVGCLMADGEAQQIDLRKSEGADEIGGVVGHRIDRVRGLSGRRGDPRFVETNDRPRFLNAVGERGIPVIHSAPKMLHEDERHAAGLAESAIREADSVGLDELCWCSLMAVLVHRVSLGAQADLPNGRKRAASAPGQDQLALCPPSTLRT